MRIHARGTLEESNLNFRGASSESGLTPAKRNPLQSTGQETTDGSTGTRGGRKLLSTKSKQQTLAMAFG